MVKTKRAAAPAKKEDVYGSIDELPDDVKERYKTLLEDFDRTVEEKISEERNKAKAVAERIHNQYMMDLMKLSKAERNRNWEEVLAEYESARHRGDGEGRESDKESEEEDMKQAKEDIASQIASEVASANKRYKTAGTSAAKIKAAAGGGGSVRRSSRKRGAAPEPFDETVLTSTANSTRMRARRGLQTPGDISIVAPPTGPAGLPLITPKVNLATPFCSTLARNPRPNEISYSVNGSPICTTAKRTGRGKKSGPAAFVKLGAGKELLLPSLDVNPNQQNFIDLDEESRAKISTVRDHLDKLLKMRKENR